MCVENERKKNGLSEKLEKSSDKHAAGEQTNQSVVGNKTMLRIHNLIHIG